VIDLSGSRRRRAVVEHAAAFLGRPAQLAQAQAADLGDLLRVGDAKAAHRKRVLHPAQVEMDEHAYAQLFDVDRACHGRLPVLMRVGAASAPAVGFRQHRAQT